MEPTMTVEIYDIDDTTWATLAAIYPAAVTAAPTGGRGGQLDFDSRGPEDEVEAILADADRALAALIVDLDPGDGWAYERDVTIVSSVLGTWRGRIREKSLVIDADALRAASDQAATLADLCATLETLTGKAWADAITATGATSPLP